MNTAQVRAALRSYYPSNEYAVMWEVGNSTGHNTRRWADAVVVSLWPSRGLTITGIEIKVSRGDWRRELENPAKAEEIAQFCDHWLVATPEGIVQEHELPFTWGHLIVNPKGAVRMAKKPDRLEPKPLTRGFVAAMLRRSSDVDAAEVKALVEKQVAVERATMESRISKQVERATAKFAKIEEKVAELKKLGLDLNGWEDAKSIVEAYETGRKFKEASSSLRHSTLPSHLEKLIEMFSKVRDDVMSLDVSRKG